MADHSADLAWAGRHRHCRDAQTRGHGRSQTSSHMSGNAEADIAASFRRLIRETGPISLSQYMGESNARYYSSRDPLGDTGDFITAPEISQMFGELIGLWLVDQWMQMGAPARVHYVELGPGRGTLAKDILRAAQRFELKPQVHMVEGSPAMRALQRGAIPAAIHHEDMSDLPEDAPLLIVANEFFDALPIRQLVRMEHGWRERMVGLENEQLAFIAGDKPMDSVIPPGLLNAGEGTVLETSPASAALMGEVAARLAQQGGAALVIDYGSLEARTGSTLQAVRAHEKVDALADPGNADLTAHVDFAMLKTTTEKAGANVIGTACQGNWLKQLGIDSRLEALKKMAPDRAEILQRQRDRLVAENAMGELFKVLAVSGRGGPRSGLGFGPAS
ncbi:MAG: SAM-dependent methyltransferase [Erythrobacter sp.]